jgi:hypothetical protein
MRRHWWQRSAQPGPDAVPAGQPAPEAVPPSLLAWAQAVDVSRLSDKTVRQVEWYLRGYRHMTLNDRQQEGFRLRDAVEPQVSPPPPADAHPMDVLATVLAVRRKQLGIG